MSARFRADAAAQLFAERGFDAVTIDEVAQAAEVARRTVVNHFPAKEGLVLDQLVASEADLLAIVRDRPSGEPLVTTFRRHAMRLIRDLTARPGTPDRAGLVALVHASPTLQRAIHAKRAGLVRQLAAEIAAATGVPAHDPVATAAAFSLLGAHRALTQEYDRRRADRQDAASGFLPDRWRSRSAPTPNATTGPAPTIPTPWWNASSPPAPAVMSWTSTAGSASKPGSSRRPAARSSASSPTHGWPSSRGAPGSRWRWRRSGTCSSSRLR